MGVRAPLNPETDLVSELKQSLDYMDVFWICFKLTADPELEFLRHSLADLKPNHPGKSTGGQFITDHVDQAAGLVTGFFLLLPGVTVPGIVLCSADDTEEVTFDLAAVWKKLLQMYLHDLFQGDESAFGNRNPPRTVGRNLEADEQRLI